MCGENRKDTAMIKAGIIGSTGYAGAELARLLLGHPEAEIVWYGSRNMRPYTEICFAWWTRNVSTTIWKRFQRRLM